jgi:glycosyltransferase involved in cell wall biosynthesis
VGDVPSVVRDGVTGFVVPPGDAPALAAAIARLLKEPSLAAQMGTAAREYVLAAHGPERMARTFLDLYRTLGAGA